MPPDLYIPLYGIIYWPFSANTVLINYWVYYFLLFIVINLWFRFDWQPCLKQALVVSCRSRWCLSADFNLCFHALRVYILYFRFSIFTLLFMCFIHLKAARHHTPISTHPNVLSVFIDLLKCLYVYPLCAGAHLSNVSYILSTRSTRDTTVCSSSITHRSVPYMPTSQCIVCIYYWFVFVCWCSSIKRLLYPQHQEYKRHYCM